MLTTIQPKVQHELTVHCSSCVLVLVIINNQERKINFVIIDSSLLNPHDGKKYIFSGQYTKISLTELVNRLVLLMLPICCNALERTYVLGITGYL